MESDLRGRAEARLVEAAQACALSDPRPPYRERLRRLRETHPDAFDRAVRHYEERVLPALAAEEPLAAWLDYGRFLGGLTGDGQLSAIDATGRAAPCEPPLPTGTLVLFIPDDPAADVLVAAAPAAPTPAQQATVRLLVDRALS